MCVCVCVCGVCVWCVCVREREIDRGGQSKSVVDIASRHGRHILSVHQHVCTCMFMYMYSGVLGHACPPEDIIYKLFQDSSEQTMVGEGGSIATRLVLVI